MRIASQGDSNEYTQYVLWRNKQNYPSITTKYPPSSVLLKHFIP